MCSQIFVFWGYLLLHQSRLLLNLDDLSGPLLIPILSQINPVHTTPSYLSSILILPRVEWYAWQIILGSRLDD
jgi:hypothetical protein